MKQSLQAASAKPILLAVVLLIVGWSATVNAESLHQQPGEEQARMEAVELFLRSVRQDVRINHILRQTGTEELKRQLLDNTQALPVMTGGTAGVEAPKGRPLQLNEPQYRLLLRHLDHAVQQHRLSHREHELLSRQLSRHAPIPATEYPLASL